MFKINLRRLLRVLFILGLLLPTYVLPSSSTSSVAFAEEGLRDKDEPGDEGPVDKCEEQKVCIQDLTPAVGEEMGRWLTFSGELPPAKYKFTLRNSTGKTIVEKRIKHNRLGPLRVHLPRLQWEVDSYNATIESEDLSSGDSMDFEVGESLSGRGFVRISGEVDAYKITAPRLRDHMENQVSVIGVLPSGRLQITLHSPSGEPVYKGVIKHDGSSELSVDFGHLAWEHGIYRLTITEPKSGYSDTMIFGVSDGSDNHSEDNTRGARCAYARDF